MLLYLQRVVQKLRKPPPVYQTQNEGSDHNPRFRSTVSVDGVSYTSSSTYQLRKVAELDVSRIAYTAITQKEKTEALQFIQQV
ncbi:putative double-stranded RNA-binding domain-containing protein [Helianthus anomalus]